MVFSIDILHEYCTSITIFIFSADCSLCFNLNLHRADLVDGVTNTMLYLHAKFQFIPNSKSQMNLKCRF